ncbi:IS3 family transposase [Paraliobacillus sp. PM-2]|uniref:IS3 family transposase n=1 Tax=Paraliobacillus sp. PM-2 TaxID=1462524 RepID=UPI00210053DA|nr:IS3 family transposase [Paraliobacillus sp. PM-2]
MYLIIDLCLIANVSKSGYYKWKKRKSRPMTVKEKDEESLKKLISKIYKETSYTYGYPRITDEIKESYKQKVNHKRVYRLMKEMNIQALSFRKKHKYKQEGNTAENILNREFDVDKPFKKLATDITYLYVGRTRLYLCAILDLYNNEIVSYHISDKNDNALVLKALEIATKKGDVKDTLIHSDQGHQFTSYAYTYQLKSYQMKKSMSNKGNCWDNAPIESFFGRLKEESIRIQKPRTKEEVYRTVEWYIDFYNNKRRQKGLGSLAPVQYKERIA